MPEQTEYTKLRLATAFLREEARKACLARRMDDWCALSHTVDFIERTMIEKDILSSTERLYGLGILEGRVA